MALLALGFRFRFGLDVAPDAEVALGFYVQAARQSLNDMVAAERDGRLAKKIDLRDENAMAEHEEGENNHQVCVGVFFLVFLCWGVFSPFSEL